MFMALCLLLLESPAVPEDTPGSVGALPGIHMDLEKGEVRLKAKVCLSQGILEYVAVSLRGKTYESVFEIEAEPSHVHAALLLLGLEAKPVEKADPAKDGLMIHIQWQGSEQEEPIEKMLLRRDTRACPEKISWIFTGSYFEKGEDGKNHYVADRVRSVIAIWPDQTALLNPVEKSLNPYRGETYGYEVKTDAIKPEGTEAWLILRRE